MYSLPQSYNQTSRCKRCICPNAYDTQSIWDYKQAKAVELLRAHIETLDRVAEFLLEQETITGKEFMKIFHEVEGKHSEPKEAVMENKIEVTDVDASQQSDEE